jgi:hypothetical protein
MVEIVLRRDIRDYQPKPFFGMTARQIVSIAACAAVSVGLYVLLSIVLGMTPTIVMWIVTVVGGSVGFLGMGKINGVRPEEWIALRMRESSVPKTIVYERPVFKNRADESGKKNPRKEKLEKHDRKRLEGIEAYECEEIAPKKVRKQGEAL